MIERNLTGRIVSVGLKQAVEWKDNMVLVPTGKEMKMLRGGKSEVSIELQVDEKRKRSILMPIEEGTSIEEMNDYLTGRKADYEVVSEEGKVLKKLTVYPEDGDKSPDVYEWSR